MLRCVGCGLERLTTDKMQAALQRVWNAAKLPEQGGFYESCAAAREQMLKELQTQMFALASMANYCACDGSATRAA